MNKFFDRNFNKFFNKFLNKFLNKYLNKCLNKYLIKLKNLFSRISSPATIFIAVNEQKPNPLPSEFLDTDFVMSVLKITKKVDTPDKVIKGFYSFPYRYLSFNN